MRSRFSSAALIIAAFVAPGAQAAGVWTSAQTLFSTLQNEASAWAITVKQTALSAHQVGQMELDAKKNLATAVGAIDMSNRVTTAVKDYSPAFGQPNTIKCVAQEQGKLHVEAVGQQARDAGRLMQTFAAGRVGSQADADQERFDMHRSMYCTVSEAKQGICELTPNGMQGWDVDYSGTMGQMTLAPEAESAGYAYAAMLADTRAEAGSDCGSAACSAAQAAQLAQAAIGSAAANTIVGQVTERRLPMLTGQ